MFFAVRLAGYAAAQGVLLASRSEGTLVPFYAYFDKATQKVAFEWVTAATFTEAANQVTQMLVSNPYRSDAGAVITDTLMSIDGKQMNVLLVELCDYTMNNGMASFAIPYTPKASAEGFTVKITRSLTLPEGFDDDITLSELIERFIDGSADNVEGAKAWAKHTVD